MDKFMNFLKPQSEMSEQDVVEFRKVMTAIAEGDKEVSKAVANYIVKYIKETIAFRDVADLTLGVDTLPLGVTPEYVMKGNKPKVYWHEPGSYAPRTQIVNKQFTVPTGMLSCHPEYELGQLVTGRYGTMAEITSDAKDEMAGAINALVWNTLKGAVTTGTNYATMSTAVLSYSALKTAVRYMQDKPGGAKCIIGRRTLLNELMDFETVPRVSSTSSPMLRVYSDSQKEAFWLRGFDAITTFEGVPVIALDQWQDAYGNNTISETDVLVLGQNIGKFVVTEDYKQLDDIDINDLMWHIHIWKRCGCAVWKSDRIYRIAGCIAG